MGIPMGKRQPEYYIYIGSILYRCNYICSFKVKGDNSHHVPIIVKGFQYVIKFALTSVLVHLVSYKIMLWDILSGNTVCITNIFIYKGIKWWIIWPEMVWIVRAPSVYIPGLKSVYTIATWTQSWLNTICGIVYNYADTTWHECGHIYIIQCNWMEQLNSIP